MKWNLIGTKCLRPGCGHRNPKNAEYCEKCGISLGFSRPAILDGNRWQPAPDEIAVHFKTRDLKGLFTKTLHVPPGMRAWVLQDSQVKELPEGEYTTETLFQRLNSFFQSPHGEVLITRTDALPVEFAFDNIKSAELLDMKVQTTLHVAVGDVHAFRRGFMLADGAVSTSNLQQLLAPAVRQIIAEQLGAKHIEDMLKDMSLRSQIDKALLTGLQKRFLDMGLKFSEVTAFTLRHDKLGQQQDLQASLWLIRKDAQVKAEHEQTINQIYDEKEWAKIKTREEDMRRRYRSANLTQEEAEFVHTIRLRELDLYEKAAKADTREKAIELGAQDALARMESEVLGRSREREHKALKDQYQASDEKTEWGHTRDLAALRRDAELRAAKIRRDEEDAIERERIKNTLEKIAIQTQLEHARLIEDEAEQQELKRLSGARLFKAEAREQQLLEARHQVAVDDVLASGKLKHREINREQDWADAQLEGKIADLQRDVRIKDSSAEMTDLGDLLKLDNQMEMDAINRKLHLKREEQQIEDEKLDKALVREVATRKGQTEDFLARSGAELQRMTVLGSLPDQTLIALADNPDKVAALLQIATVRVHANMSPEQIRASAPGQTAAPLAQPMFASAPSAPSGPSPEERTRALFKEAQDGANQWADRMERSHESERSAMLAMAAMIKDTALGVAQANAQPINVSVATPPQAHTSPQPQVWASAAPVPSSFKSCPKCRTANVADAGYCSKCGHQLP